MPLNVGSRLGHYDVTAPLGAGGMGEVYQARDTKLGRNVALKVLPEAFTSDPDRLARFEREAKVLASLTIRTSAPSTGWKRRRARRRWSSNWSTGRPWRIALSRGRSHSTRHCPSLSRSLRH